MTDRVNKIAFADADIEKAFREIKEGRYEERQLFEFIRRAIEDMKKNPFCGTRIPSKLWPEEYVKKYNIKNLMKYDLPNGWRLIYTIRGNELEIISIIIEWFDHKNYERRFKYS